MAVAPVRGDESPDCYARSGVAERRRCRNSPRKNTIGRSSRHRLEFQDASDHHVVVAGGVHHRAPRRARASSTPGSDGVDHSDGSQSSPSNLVPRLDRRTGDRVRLVLAQHVDREPPRAVGCAAMPARGDRRRTGSAAAPGTPTRTTGTRIRSVPPSSSPVTTVTPLANWPRARRISSGDGAFRACPGLGAGRFRCHQTASDCSSVADPFDDRPRGYGRPRTVTRCVSVSGNPRPMPARAGRCLADRDRFCPSRRSRWQRDRP